MRWSGEAPLHRLAAAPRRCHSATVGVCALASALLACGARLSEPPVTPPPSGDAAAEGDPSQEVGRRLYLWSVSSPEKPGKVWLMGSVHIGRTTPELDTEIWTAFQNADFLAVEIDLEEMSVDRFDASLLAASRYPKGNNLRRSIGETLYTRCEEAFEEAGIPTEDLSRLRPWTVAHRLSGVQAHAAGWSAGLGLDQLFMAHARTLKPIRSLETPEIQMRAISAASETLQIAMLSSLLVGGAELNTARIDELLAAYQQGDDEHLMRSTEMLESSPELKEFNAAMLDRRNVGMAKTIAGYLDKAENGFVVVGAAHLVGEHSIVQLLGERGMTVTRIAPSGELAEIPAKGPGDRPTARGYDVEWGGHASPPVTSWRDGKMVDVITARSGAVLFQLAAVPLNDVEKTMPLSLLFNGVVKQLQRSSRTQVVSRRAATVSGARGQTVELRGRGVSLQLLLTACDRKVYMLTALVRAPSIRGADKKRVDKVMKSFSLRL
jgi:uncharacterized protein YbaP (TraB family)